MAAAFLHACNQHCSEINSSRSGGQGRGSLSGLHVTPFCHLILGIQVEMRSFSSPFLSYIPLIPHAEPEHKQKLVICASIAGMCLLAAMRP